MWILTVYYQLVLWNPLKDAWGSPDTTSRTTVLAYIIIGLINYLNVTVRICLPVSQHGNRNEL